MYSGKDGRVLQTLTAEAMTDAFGRHVTSAGDVDRDGHDDVMIGAPNNAAGGKDAAARTSIPARTAKGSRPGPENAKATTSAPPPQAIRAAR